MGSGFWDKTAWACMLTLLSFFSETLNSSVDPLNISAFSYKMESYSSLPIKVVVKIR